MAILGMEAEDGRDSDGLSQLPRGLRFYNKGVSSGELERSPGTSGRWHQSSEGAGS